MSKVVIIRDCTKCPYSGQGTSHIGCRKTNKAIAINYIPDWCPLPDLPERLLCEGDSERIKNFRLEARKQGIELRMGSFGWGWNECIDAITGRKD